MRSLVISDIHGNIVALEAALADIKRQRPDHILVCGDLVMQGPRPGEVADRLRTLEKEGGKVIAGNTDIAVADFDYVAAFPWMEDVPATTRAAAEWAHEQLSDDQLDWLRRLPSERRVWADDVLVLACHGSPGSQTNGLPTDMDVGVLVERVTRTDARVIACGHTHVADVRQLGRKLIVNPGSCGYAFDGDPAACWALITIPDQPQSSGLDDEDEDEAMGLADVVDDARPAAELFRPRYDAAVAADEVAKRGLAGDVYRAATIRNGRQIS